MSDRAEINCALLIEDREKAIQIEHKGVVAWIPKSQIDYQRRQKLPSGKIEITLHIPEWLAEEKRLDYA